jgi:methionine biosynthesis protein MetW
MIDNPTADDNRRYDYSKCDTQARAEYPMIVEMIRADSTVIDFGCGNGSLLYLLKTQKNVSGLGYDISESGIEACRRKGLRAVCTAIDRIHKELQDGQFDYAICNVTLQMVMYPEVLLGEMVRVARYQIVSFPNFAYYRNRLDMLLHGRMPQPMLFGYKWYSTGHIHQLSLSDFEQLLKDIGRVRVVDRRRPQPLSKNLLKRYVCQKFPNLFEAIPIYLLEKPNAV